MKGFLKIEPAEHNGASGLALHCSLSDVSLLDKAGIVDGIMQALDIDIEELAMLVAVMKMEREANAVTMLKVSLDPPDTDS